MNNPQPEEEVLSIPAANTFELVSRHAVYSCPAARKYRDSIYMTFRSKGSTMDRLFLLEGVYDRVCTVDAIQRDATIPQPHKDRILAYLKDPKAAEVLVELDPTNKDFGQLVRFYVLDRIHAVWLPHQAKQERPSEGHAYYTLKELMNPVTSIAARPSSQEEV